MKWQHKQLSWDDPVGYWITKTALGEFAIERCYEGFVVFLFPHRAADEVRLGTRTTLAGAQRFVDAYVRRIAKRMLEQAA